MRARSHPTLPSFSSRVLSRSAAALVSLLLGALALVATRARADVVEDLACPPGLDVRGGHERDCWPRTCTSDAQCGEGASCRPVSRCIQTRDIHEGDSPDTIPRDLDVGACGANGSCASPGALCRPLSRCEPREATPAFVDGRWTGERYVAPMGAGCSATPARPHAGELTLLAAIGGVVLAAARRWRGARR